MADLSNRVIEAFSPADAAALQPYLRRVELRSREIICHKGQPVNLVYFPTGAVISLVVANSRCFR